MSENTVKKVEMQQPSALPVLPEETPLRNCGLLLEPERWDHADGNNAPRALRGLSKIVDGGLCHRCGSCIGICPTDVLSLDAEGYPQVGKLSACTDCDLCVKVCPGDEFDFHTAHQRQFGNAGELISTHGEFLEAMIAYSTHGELREHSTSGGLVTGILLHLLETKQIDGAVVIASDDEKLWRGKPIIARTAEQILSATKSKYAISPTNAVFAELLQTPGRYALVGLPCQIHGFHKAAELDARLKERVVLTIGLFCHAAIEHEAFELIWESLGQHADDAMRFISRVGKHPGAPHIVKSDKSLYPVYFGHKRGYRPSSMEVINVLYRLYTPPRCLTCFDATAEFADIAVGDPWMPPPEDDVDFKQGWSFALLRTERAQQLCEEMRVRENIVTREVTRREALNCNHKMATEKRWRAFRVIETHRRQGKPIPTYGRHDFSLPRHSGLQFLETEANMLSHILCFMPRLRAPVLRLMLSDLGYWFFWLNNKRRRLKFWLRDMLARVVRKVRGRR